MKISAGKCLAQALANRAAENSARPYPRARYIRSFCALARRFKIKVDGWERNFALKARENPVVTAKEFGDNYLALVQAFEAAFPKIAEHYGEITAVDFTLLPYSFERGVPIHLSAALDVFTRQVRNFALHEGWPSPHISPILMGADRRGIF